jgi:plasmid rolling circle replication initiator protein Rep
VALLYKGVKQLQMLENMTISKDFISNVVVNQKYNQDTIINYYYMLQNEFQDLNFSNKIDNISGCNSYWLLDAYNLQKKKVFKKTNLCKDKFCNNCKKVKQAARLARFTPKIDELKKDYNLYHVTFTVPNCKGSELDSTIKHIFKGFYYLNRYLNSSKKVKGLDFSSFGYVGALRSLEVTFKNDSYHPHLHCIFAFKNELDMLGKFTNKFSYSYGKYERSFSSFEVLIQSIWYLVINNIKVNKENVLNGYFSDNIYSCACDKIEGDSYYEVFKYMTKATDESSNVLSYENFKALYFALHRVRQIQGYGVFYNFKDDDKIINEVDEIFNSIIQDLQKKESPIEVSEAPSDLLNDTDYTILSRNKIYSYLREL